MAVSGSVVMAAGEGRLHDERGKGKWQGQSEGLRNNISTGAPASRHTRTRANWLQSPGITMKPKRGTCNPPTEINLILRAFTFG